jgi:hypothetical protein
MGFGYNRCSGTVSVGHRALLYRLLGFEANIPGIDQRRAHRLRTRVRTDLPYRASSQRFALTLYLSDETYTVDVGTWRVVTIAESCDVSGDGIVDR